jgi:hypothetical protein
VQQVLAFYFNRGSAPVPEPVEASAAPPTAGD